MRRAELVASAWGLTRPHFMARPSAPTDPYNSPPPFDLLIYWVISARLEVWALGIETSARIQPLYLHARKHPEPGPHLRTSAFTAPPVFLSFSKLPKFICDKGTPLSRGRDCPPTALPFVVRLDLFVTKERR